MEKSKEEYLKLIENRQIKEKDLPRELLDDEEFVRQVYKIDKFIVYSADIDISANIFREEIETKPYVFAQFPKKVLLMCEEECVKALKKQGLNKETSVKVCPKEILINHPDLCDYLLEEGVSPEFFPEEVLSRYPSDYIQDKKTNAQAKKEAEKMKIMPKPPVRRIRDTSKRTEVVNKGESTKGGKIYSKEVLLSKPELTRRLLKAGTPLEHIPRECQILFSSLCIEHLKDGDYESNFKHLADEIKIKHMDVCIQALKDLINIKEDGHIKRNSAIYGYIPVVLYSNKNFIIEVAKFDDEIFEHIPKENYSDLKFVEELVQLSKAVISHIDRQIITSHPQIIRNALKDGTPLKYISEEFQIQFQELCIQHLKEGDYESNFKHLADEIKVKHADVCIAAIKNLNKVKKNGYMQKNEAIYGYIPNKLYSDIGFITSVARFDDEIFDYIPRENYGNAEFAQELFKVNKRVARYVDSQILISNPRLTKELLESGVPLEYIPEECQLMFPGLCIKHLKDGSYQSNFKNLADEIKIKYINICVLALKTLGKVGKNGYKNRAIYGYIPNEVYSNLDFIKAVARFDDEIFEHIPKENYSNVEFVQELLKINRRATNYVTSQILKESPESEDGLSQTDRRVPEYDESQILKKLMNRGKVRIGVEWQKECLSEIKDEQNVILSSPTGSGKTRVFLEWAKQKQERPIYITAPIKALSNQRWRELREQGFIVGLETGDRKYMPENCDFICCTQEIYRNKYTEQKNATLIMDEFHYIFSDNSRARAYIDALHDSKAKNILLCSATFGKMSKLVKHVKKVSGRDFHAYENHDRLTELEFRGKMDKRDIKNALVVAFNTKKFKSMCDEISMNRTEKDEDEINKIRTIAQKYKLAESELEEYAKKGVMYYYGKMLPKEKSFIEELFENKLIDTVIGTDALAMGVNFPIENVVFAEIRKNKNLFDQLAGRSGRKGYFDKGYTYYCDNFEWQKTRGKGLYIADSYYELLFSKNESISISLSPRIKSILLGQTTIEEELEFIAKYSTESVDLKQKREKIESIIDYIQKYDLVEVVINNEFGKKTDKERSTEEEIKLQEEIEDRKKELMPLQEEFKANIASTYFEGTGVEINCRIFTKILLGEDLDKLIKSYGKSFSNLLEFRQYILGLPKVYRQSIDLVELENRINSIDPTVLNFERGILSTDEIASGVREELLETDELKEALNTMASQLGISEKKEQDYGNAQIGA